MTDTSQPVFLFGAGYCAQALAAIWPGPVSASVRSRAQEKPLQQARITPVQCMDGATLTDAHVLISAPPDQHGCPGLAALEEYISPVASVTYLSTTGVYGDLRGGWAMEWTEVNPQSERAARRVVAEDAWRTAFPAVRIVRLPGIYGPGRSQLDRVRGGKAQRLVKPGQVFSRAHVGDIASGLKALIMSGATGVFHLCDEEAAPPQDVTSFAADLLGITLPPEIDLETADLSEMARSFYSECKRVSNARLKAVTGWRPRYPTYREGLKAILAGGG